MIVSVSHKDCTLAIMGRHSVCIPADIFRRRTNSPCLSLQKGAIRLGVFLKAGKAYPYSCFVFIHLLIYLDLSYAKVHLSRHVSTIGPVRAMTFFGLTGVNGLELQATKTKIICSSTTGSIATQ